MSPLIAFQHNQYILDLSEGPIRASGELSVRKAGTAAYKQTEAAEARLQVMVPTTHPYLGVFIPRFLSSNNAAPPPTRAFHISKIKPERLRMCCFTEALRWLIRRLFREFSYEWNLRNLQIIFTRNHTCLTRSCCCTWECFRESELLLPDPKFTVLLLSSTFIFNHMMNLNAFLKDRNAAAALK